MEREAIIAALVFTFVWYTTIIAAYRMGRDRYKRHAIRKRKYSKTRKL